MARTGLVDGTYAQRWLAERCRSESVPFILFPDDPNNGTLRFCPIHCGSEMTTRRGDPERSSPRNLRFEGRIASPGLAPNSRIPDRFESTEASGFAWKIASLRINRKSGNIVTSSFKNNGHSRIACRQREMVACHILCLNDLG